MLSKYCKQANDSTTRQHIPSPIKQSPVKSSSSTIIQLLCFLEPIENADGSVRDKLSQYTPQEIQNLSVVGMSIINGYSLMTFLKENVNPSILLYRDGVS